MAEAFVNVTEGAGKKLHGWDRVIGANTVVDEAVFPGEFPYPSYVTQAEAISIATANDHVLQIMAGATLNVRIRRIRIEQEQNAAAASVRRFQFWRLSTAGTGGTAVTPAKMDTADAASGATAMTLPTVKGTEATLLWSTTLVMRQAIAATGTQPEETYEWVQHPGMKPLIIPAGVANGFAIKTLSGTAGATVIAVVEFVETSFTG